MKIHLGLSSVSDLIEVRRGNFMDRLIKSDRYAVLLKAFVVNCFESRLVLWFCVSMCVYLLFLALYILFLWTHARLSLSLILSAGCVIMRYKSSELTVVGFDKHS